jgi:hypothetical protein
MPKNIPNGHKIYQHFSFQGPPNFSKFYSNWDFWFENKPSGNLVHMEMISNLRTKMGVAALISRMRTPTQEDILGRLDLIVSDKPYVPIPIARKYLCRL